MYFNFGLIASIGFVFPIAGYFFLKDGLDGKWIWFILLSVVLFTIGYLMILNLKRKNIRPVFYLTIAFITSIICFGMPMANAITINTEYKELSLLNDWQARENVTVYEFTYFTPELIWDYGNSIEVLAKNGEIKIPSQSKFAVLVAEEDTELFQKTFSNFKLERITRYDMNAKGPSDRSHKTRLYRDLYLVTKL